MVLPLPPRTALALSPLVVIVPLLVSLLPVELLEDIFALPNKTACALPPLVVMVPLLLTRQLNTMLI